MYPDFKGLASVFLSLAGLAVFGLWKLVELVIWAVRAVLG